VCTAAAAGGHLDLIKLLVRAAGGAQNLTMYYARRERKHYWPRPWLAAVRGGHLELLKWMHADGNIGDPTACAVAADGGHLEVLQWLLTESLQWGDRWRVGEAFNRAAAGGHLAMLQCLRTAGYPWPIKNNTVIAGAVRGGHTHVARWAAANDCKSYDSSVRLMVSPPIPF
jgi:hypothetical protein